VQRLVDFD